MHYRTIPQLTGGIAAIMIFLFVYTATAKLFSFSLFQVTLSKSPLIGTKAVFVSWFLTITELLVAGLLFFRNTRRIGFYAALILFVLFTLYILYMLLFESHLPCSCGGIIQLLSWKEHFAVNVFCTGLIVLALTSGKEKLLDKRKITAL